MTINEIKTLLEKNPNDAGLWFLLGEEIKVKYSYETLKDFNEKIKCYEKAVKLDPFLTDAIYALAIAHEQRGVYQSSKRHLEKLKQLGDTRKNLDSDIQRIEQKLEKQRLRQLQNMEKRLFEKPDDPETIKQAGYFFRLEGEKEKGLTLLEYAVELKPDLTDGHYFLALAYKEDNEYEKAIECFQKYLKLETDDENIHTLYELIAECYEKLEAFDKAIEYQNKSLECNPSGWNKQHPFYRLGFIFSKRGDHRKAIEYYNKAIEEEPASDFAYYLYNHLSNEYYQLNELEKALECLQKSVSLKPDYDQAFYKIGVLNEMLGDDELAEIGYNMALKANRLNYHALNNLGKIYYERNESNKSIECFLNAIEIDPEFSLPYKNLATIYHALQDYDKEDYYLQEYYKRDKGVLNNFSFFYFPNDSLNLSMIAS